MTELLIATQNIGKQKEFAKLLAELSLELVFPQNIEKLSKLDVEESGESICANSNLKAVAFAQLAGILSLADDSSLEVDALDGAPGIHSKRFFAGDAKDRNQEILKRMKNQIQRQARFKTCLCLVDPQDPNQVEYFTGEMTGEISHSEQGSYGFDYDRIFIPEGYDQTYAQLGEVIKNTQSHRQKAFAKLKNYLRNKYA